MDAGNARTLLERLGCRRIKVYGEEITCSCPHADLHKRGDRRPSFGAHIDDSGTSPYLCFGCHSSGTLEWLATQTGNQDLVPEWKSKTIKAQTFIRRPSDNFQKFGHLYIQERPRVFRDLYIKPFVGVLSAYLKNRGITVETAKAWELGVDREHRRATFVSRDVEGRVAVVIGRDLTGRSRAKYSNYVLDRKNKKMVPFIDHKREDDFVSPTKKFFLFGEYQAFLAFEGKIERRSTDLIVVEGPMDVLAMWQQGYNVVGVMGSRPSSYQLEKLVSLLRIGSRLVVLADPDEAGEKMVHEIVDGIGGRVLVFVGRLPEGVDPGSATAEQLETAISEAKIMGLDGFKTTG